MVECVEQDAIEILTDERLESIHNFEWASVTPIGLHVTSRNLDYEQYEQDVLYLLAMDNATQWSIGDAYNWGEIILPKNVDPSQAFSARRVKIKTIQNYAWVCNRYSYRERMYPPSFSHHAVVAKLPQERRYFWLMSAVLEDMSVEDLSEATAVERGIEYLLPNPFFQLVEYYNSSIQAFQRLPDYPEKPMIQRGLKLLEQGINEIEKRISGK